MPMATSSIVEPNNIGVSFRRLVSPTTAGGAGGPPPVMLEVGIGGAVCRSSLAPVVSVRGVGVSVGVGVGVSVGIAVGVGVEVGITFGVGGGVTVGPGVGVERVADAMADLICGAKS